MAGSPQFPRKFVWYELASPDARRAQAFYADVLGWRVAPLAGDGSPYVTIRASGTHDAALGGYAPAPRGSPSRWTPYVSVDDVDAVARAAAANGGHILLPPHDVAGVGRSARIVDPEGAELGLLHGASGGRFDDEAKPGHFLGSELHAADPRRELAFYGRVLGFEHEATDTGEAYPVLSPRGAGQGGVTRLGDHELPHWLPYVRVADVDATVTRAKRFGAKVTTPPRDVPGVGRFGVLTDPTGAAIAVIKPFPVPKP